MSEQVTAWRVGSRLFGSREDAEAYETDAKTADERRATLEAKLRDGGFALGNIIEGPCLFRIAHLDTYTGESPKVRIEGVNSPNSLSFAGYDRSILLDELLSGRWKVVAHA